MGTTQSHEGGGDDDTDALREVDNDVREMKDIGEPVSSTTAPKRSRRQTRHASTKSSAKSKGSYAAVRKTRRR